MRLTADHTTLRADSPWIKSQSDRSLQSSSDAEMELHLLGEIYNEDLQGENQAQRLLDAYRREGEALFPRLNGQFALIVDQKITRQWRLVCDRTASVPIYYFLDQSRFAFSCSLRELIRSLPGKPRISLEAIAGFLACGYYCDGLTPIAGLRALGPGGMIVAQDGSVQLKKYWEYAFADRRDERPQPELEADLLGLLEKAVSRRTQGTDRFGILLSGGYDSRAILGCSRRRHPQRDLFTITWGEHEQAAQGDANIAREVSQLVNAQHSFFELNASQLPHHFRTYVLLSEGRTDAVGNYPEGLLIFERLRSQLGLEYVLRGDECFGGSQQVLTDREGLHRLGIHSLRDLAGGFSFIKASILRILRHASEEMVARLLANCPYRNLHDRKDYFCYTQHIFGYLNPLTQLKQQAIGVRNPHLDNDVIDFTNRLPTAYRLDKILFRQTVKHRLAQVSQVRFARQSSIIDWDRRLQTDSDLQRYVSEILLHRPNAFDEIIERKKLQEFLRRVFQSSRMWDRGLTLKVRKRLRRAQAGFTLSSSSELFRLMIIKIWVDEFVGGEFDLS